MSTHVIPKSIPADPEAKVQDQLTKWLSELPKGTPSDPTVAQLLPGKVYGQDKRTLLYAPENLIFDLNGSELRSTRENSYFAKTDPSSDGIVTDQATGAKGPPGFSRETDPLHPNLMVFKGRNVRIVNGRLQGNFHETGKRSQQRVNQITVGGEAYAHTQGNPGVGIYGGHTIYVEDVKLDHNFGDGVITAMSHYFDWQHPGGPECPQNVHILRCDADKNARMNYAPVTCIGFWLEDSKGRDGWYGACDAEVDGVEQFLKDIHVLRNDFADYALVGMVIPVPGIGDNIGSFEIAGNKVGRPDNVCMAPISLGGWHMAYPAYRFVGPITIEDNEVWASASGVSVENVVEGTIRNNLVHYSEAGCAHPGKPPIVDIRSSGTVTQDNNGPDVKLKRPAGPIKGDSDPEPFPDPTPAPEPVPIPQPVPTPIPVPQPGPTPAPTPAPEADGFPEFLADLQALCKRHL